MMKVMFYPLAAVVNVLTTLDSVMGKIGGTGLLMKFYYMSLIFGRTATATFMIVDGLTEMTRKLTRNSKLIMDIIGIATMWYGGGMMLKGGRALLGVKGGRAALRSSKTFSTAQSGYIRHQTAGLQGKELAAAAAQARAATYSAGGKAYLYGGGAVAGYGANTLLQSGDSGMGQTYMDGNNGYGAYQQSLYIENAIMNNTNMNDTFYAAQLNQ